MTKYEDRRKKAVGIISPFYVLQEVDRSSSPLRTAQSEKLLPEYDDSLLRKRLKFIVRSIMECKEDGVYPVEMFLEKPLKKDYPDYYDIIVQPIDMKTIINKVQNDKVCNSVVLWNDMGKSEWVSFSSILQKKCSWRISNCCVKMLEPSTKKVSLNSLMIR